MYLRVGENIHLQHIADQTTQSAQRLFISNFIKKISTAANMAAKNNLISKKKMITAADSAKSAIAANAVNAARAAKVEGGVTKVTRAAQADAAAANAVNIETKINNGETAINKVAQIEATPSHAAEKNAPIANVTKAEPIIVNTTKNEVVAAEKIEALQAEASTAETFGTASITTLIDKQSVEKMIMELSNAVQKELPNIKQIFNDCKGIKKSSNRMLKVDINHIWEMKLKWKGDRATGMGGFHHDPNQMVEKCGIFEFRNKVKGKFGCYSADIYLNDHFVDTKTFFPADWTREKVAEKIREAYINFNQSNAIADIERDGKYFISGFTQEGIEIHMYFTPKDLMTTAYINIETYTNI